MIAALLRDRRPPEGEGAGALDCRGERRGRNGRPNIRPRPRLAARQGAVRSCEELHSEAPEEDRERGGRSVTANGETEKCVRFLPALLLWLGRRTGTSAPVRTAHWIGLVPRRPAAAALWLAAAWTVTAIMLAVAREAEGLFLFLSLSLSLQVSSERSGCQRRSQHCGGDWRLGDIMAAPDRVEGSGLPPPQCISNWRELTMQRRGTVIPFCRGSAGWQPLFLQFRGRSRQGSSRWALRKGDRRPSIDCQVMLIMQEEDRTEDIIVICDPPSDLFTSSPPVFIWERGVAKQRLRLGTRTNTGIIGPHSKGPTFFIFLLSLVALFPFPCLLDLHRKDSVLLSSWTGQTLRYCIPGTPFLPCGIPPSRRPGPLHYLGPISMTEHGVPRDGTLLRKDSGVF